MFVRHARRQIFRIHYQSLHTSRAKSASALAQNNINLNDQNKTVALQSPLSILPTTSILRTWLITSITSSPLLLRTSLAVLRRMLDPRALILSPKHNPLLKYLFMKTFYKQFCAGEDRVEVQRTVNNIKVAGYTGVILEYALEVLDDMDGKMSTSDAIETWRKGMLQTVDMCSPGDYVALKWSGLGIKALRRLNNGEQPSKAMTAAIQEVCHHAADRNIGLLPGAELEKTNKGIHDWTLGLQRQFNQVKPGKAIMYSTYQAYLRSTPRRIAEDLAVAHQHGFTLGVKLVRGAYLESEPAKSITESKEATDIAYDGIVAAVLSRKWNKALQCQNPNLHEFPHVALVLASHNQDSVRKAQDLQDAQAAASKSLVECTYTQLQGMADELSCKLIAANAPGDDGFDRSTSAPMRTAVRAYKFVSWGSLDQCLNYLYRRALENQDAAGRTLDTRKAMTVEVMRRLRAALVGA